MADETTEPHETQLSMSEIKLRSPMFVKLFAVSTPIRIEQLVEAARMEERPKRPEPGECCGSSCDPCVNTLYREELKVWKECQVP